MKKYILISLASVLIGGLIGGIVVFYGYDSFGIFKESSKETQEVDELVSCDVQDFDLTGEEIDLKSAAAYLKFKEIKSSFIPSGVPDVYGEELDISFDEVQDAIDKVAPFDPTYGERKIILNGTDLERYIEIGSQTACKYCCGAKTLVRKDGEAACGCAHSQMMRGLAAYLIKNHPELSNEQVLKELNTWRITYFPKQTLTEKLAEMEKVGESGIKEILQEFPDFLPQMVGGC